MFFTFCVLTISAEILYTPDPVSKLFDKGRKDLASPKEIISTFRFMQRMHEYEQIGDPLVREYMKNKATLEFGVGIAINKIIDAYIDLKDEQGYFQGGGLLRDKYLIKSWLKTATNLLMTPVKGVGAVEGQFIDQMFIVAESWEETVSVLDKLPPEEMLTPAEREGLHTVYFLKNRVNEYRKIRDFATTTFKRIPSRINDLLHEIGDADRRRMRKGRD
jgi:hypothetical protein